MRRVLLLVTGAVLFGSICAPAAGAAEAQGVEFGDTCLLEQGGPPAAANFELSRPGDPLPTAAPISGVLTKWIVRTPADLPERGLPQTTVRVVRVLGPGRLEVTAVGKLESLHKGQNEFETRLPIAAGEYLALGSNQGSTPFCATTNEELEHSPLAQAGGIPWPLPEPGKTGTYQIANDAVPVSGVIEPDVDGDGYGDLTQDECPQSAEYQGPCPTLNFLPTYTVRTGTVEVKLKSTAKATVAINGMMPGLSTALGARKTIPAGKLATFELAIPPALEARLHRLDSRKALRVRLVARVDHVTGNVSTDRLTVLLPGRRAR